MTAPRLPAFVLGVALSLGTATVARAQTPADPELRRALASYPASPSATVAALQRLSLSRLSARDKSIAELYRGFSLIQLKRNADAEGALQRAVAFDPTATPDPANGSDLLDAYRIARARVPVISTFEFSRCGGASQKRSVGTKG